MFCLLNVCLRLAHIRTLGTYGKSTATCPFTFPTEKGGLQVKFWFPLGTLFTSVWGNLERCSQFDDSTRQMLAICYQEALQESGCLNLLELQDASQHLSWKVTSTNEVTFACYLANKLEIWVEWDPFHPDFIASAPNATLAALGCQVKLPLSIQIDGEMMVTICLKTESDLTMTEFGRRQTTFQSFGWTGPEPGTAFPSRMHFPQLRPIPLAL